MELQDLITTDPQTCNPNASLQEVAGMMRDNDCGMIPILAEDGSNEAIGTITDRDIIIRCIADGHNPLEKTAGEAMTENPVSIHFDSDFQEAMELMEEHQIRRLLVVDDNNHCYGVLSQADLARGASGEQIGEVVQHVSEPGEGPSARR